MSNRLVVMLDCVWVKVGKGSSISGDVYGHPQIKDGTRVCTRPVKAVDGLFQAGNNYYNPTFIGEKDNHADYDSETRRTHVS